MHRYCTITDIRYVAKAITMIRSLLENSPQAHITVFCFDTESINLMEKCFTDRVQIIPWKIVETDLYRKLKTQRSVSEYFWTCTPKSLLYCLENLNYSEITYLDADLLFFGDPSTILDWGAYQNANAIITPHRFHPRYEQWDKGIYCVQFVHLRGAEGLKIARWWTKACEEWCFNRVEPGRFGDQKYLDSWPTMFTKVISCDHPGVGLAPWNALKHTIRIDSDNFIEVGANDQWDPLVFYHFHGLKFFTSNKFDRYAGYEVGQTTEQIIYSRYEQELQKTLTILAQAKAPKDRRWFDEKPSLWESFKNFVRGNGKVGHP